MEMHICNVHFYYALKMSINFKKEIKNGILLFIQNFFLQIPTYMTILG